MSEPGRTTRNIGSACRTRIVVWRRATKAVRGAVAAVFKTGKDFARMGPKVEPRLRRNDSAAKVSNNTILDPAIALSVVSIAAARHAWKAITARLAWAISEEAAVATLVAEEGDKP